MESNATDSTPTGKGREIEVDTCATCDESVDTDEWHPIAVDVGDGGDVQLHVFCSRVCQAAWERD